MLQFAHVNILWFLVSIPLLLAGYLFHRRNRRRALRNLGDEDLINYLMPDLSRPAQTWKFIFSLVALTLIIIAAAGPRIGTRLQEVEQKGREIIIALDVSNSMLAEDVKPSRLERSKQIISRMVDRMTNDRIGLILFAGDAYTQIPITDDYPSVKMFLESAGPDMVSKQGTAIGSAIALAARSFPEILPEKESAPAGANRAIVVITDGENHEDDAIGETQKAVEKGIRVYTVGLGDPNGVPIPVKAGSTATRRDKEGNVVVSKLNEKLLIEIASAGEGAYIPGDRISSLIDELDKLQKEEFKSKLFSDYAERFQYFAGFGLLFLLFEFLIRSRKIPFIQKLKLFRSEI
ncbi:MAG: VWA domain-containing protein [Bacteroidales bacterium]|nr:VWA domain-containing protein [Bacteroidales bacterium]MBN2697712.1 VWA domain-containing protein [Bacteroidales bacterium]